ncbi:MAG: hypothetical protein ACUVQ0_06635 [Thermoproteota archaeon]
MAYFTVRDVVSIALFAALWGILNAYISPLFFQATKLPFFCDIAGFISLILAVWWTRRPGVATSVGIVATILNFLLRPGALHFLGFTVASIVFDVLMKAFGYDNCFKKRLLGSILVIVASVIPAGVAGLIIGKFFMNMPPEGVLGWMLLHMLGGLIGGVLGWMLLHMLGGLIGGVLHNQS